MNCYSQGNGSGSINFFGARSGVAGLTDTFYDFKQDRTRRPTPMEPNVGYNALLTQFVRGGFNEAVFSTYYKSDKPLYSSQIFIPRVPAEEGPRAFGLQDVVQPRMWAALYKGRVIAPEAGTFRFAGYGDDVLVVRFDGRIVLDAGINNYTSMPPGAKYNYEYMASVGTS